MEKNYKVAFSLLLAASTAIGAGCQRALTTHNVEIQSEPVADAATELRNWEPSHARYASTVTVAGATGFRYEPTSSVDDNLYYAVTPVPLVLANAFILPFALISSPGRVEYTPAKTPETYTAMPVIPMAGTYPPASEETAGMETMPVFPASLDPTTRSGAIVPVTPLQVPGTTAPTGGTIPSNGSSRTIPPVVPPSTRPAPPVGRPFPPATTVPGTPASPNTSSMNKD